ncbi:MAG: DNA recombination protein RmuC [Deltaproteobacteria bacterium]|nr:DNA recombination protein RmuC [Deltaproteobacteria bacterium]
MAQLLLLHAVENELKVANESIEQQQVQIQNLRIDHVRQQEANNHLEKALELSHQRDSELTDLRSQLMAKQCQIATLSTRLDEQQHQNEEKIQLLSDAKNTLSEQFKGLAHEIFEAKERRFSEQSSQQIQGILNPFRDQLHDFKKKVDEVYVSDVRDRSSLKQELSHLRQLNIEMNREAVNLTRALKGDNKTQGNWGELVLQRVLEQSGLRAGIEYDAQGAFRDADNRLLKPDVIVHLPENKDVIIDSKVSLVAYERYCNEEDANLRQHALQQHVLAVKQHITTLSEKDYSSLVGINSLDFVLLFMPIESAFMVAFQADDSLFNHAFERRIVVVAPTTLLATLRTIENIWRYERQNNNAQVIAERAGAIYDKLRGFVDDMEKLGLQLATVESTYAAAMTKLTQGRGNLISQANRFVELGVKVRKPLSKTILEKSELAATLDGELDL